MTFDWLTLLFIFVALGAVAIFILLPRYGPHYTSRLTCPKCHKSFNFHYIPGATLASIIQRNYRTLKCPYCHTKAVYDIALTRTRSPRPQKTKLKA